MKNKILIKKLEHKGYTEFINLKKDMKKKGLKVPVSQIFGQWHYFYKSKKGEISLVELKNYSFIDKKDLWEIYEISEISDNNLFEDVQRFDTKEQAEKRIKELLE